MDPDRDEVVVSRGRLGLGEGVEELSLEIVSSGIVSNEHGHALLSTIGNTLV